jgi:phosphate transport system substrate-binding protein
VVVHRSDGSGTTNIFTSYLSAVSADWKSKVGSGTSVNWPVGLGGRGNAGVAGLVQQTPGAIGYVELAYLLENNMAYALLENRAGHWVYPSVPTVAAAAATKPDISATNFSIVDSNCAQCYPISGYSWVVMYKKPTDPQRAAIIKTLMSWLVTGAQPIAKTVDYVPLPKNVQQTALNVIGEMEK